MKKIDKSLNRQYLNYCGKDSDKRYERANWESLKSCLTDGRVHLVYKVYGKSGKALDEFDESDLTILRNALLEGAELSVTEHDKDPNGLQINFKCNGASVIAKDVVCSSAALMWPADAKDYGRSHLTFRVLTNGLREWNDYHKTGDVRATGQQDNGSARSCRQNEFKFLLVC